MFTPFTLGGGGVIRAVDPTTERAWWCNVMWRPPTRCVLCCLCSVGSLGVHFFFEWVGVDNESTEDRTAKPTGRATTGPGWKIGGGRADVLPGDSPAPTVTFTWIGPDP